MPEVPLVYGNGPKNSYTVSENSCVRKNLQDQDVSDFKYVSPGLIPRYEESHASDDVGLWAQGPLSFMFHTTHKQSYIGHVLAFSICAGPYSDQKCPIWSSQRRNHQASTKTWPIVLGVTVFLLAIGLGLYKYRKQLSRRSGNELEIGVNRVRTEQA